MHGIGEAIRFYSAANLVRQSETWILNKILHERILIQVGAYKFV